MNSDTEGSGGAAGPEVPALSVIVPASNEAGFIKPCLRALLASEGVCLQVVVVANGCRDDTATRARAMEGDFAARGWRLDVIERATPGKPGALNAGDMAALYPLRAYLDADVTVSPPLMEQIAHVLSRPGARFASGTPQVAPASSAFTRAYGRFWSALPFMTQGVPGFGLYAVNAEGRARWGAFPAIIADDLFMRLHFAPDERVTVPAMHRSPLAEGLGRLIRVRRRQDQGNVELKRLYPNLMANEIRTRPGMAGIMVRALRDPAGFAAYALVAILVRLGWSGQSGWVRGR